jgi:hypothetical protein
MTTNRTAAPVTFTRSAGGYAVWTDETLLGRVERDGRLWLAYTAAGHLLHTYPTRAEAGAALEVTARRVAEVEAIAELAEPTEGDLAEQVELVRNRYLDLMADARQDDLAAGIADVHDDPIAVLDELMTTAAELKVVAGDYWTVSGWEQAPIVRALGELAHRITDGLTVAELEDRLYPIGTRVTLPARRPAHEVYVVAGAPVPTGVHGERRFVRLELEADRELSRSGWVDELVPVRA